MTTSHRRRRGPRYSTRGMKTAVIAVIAICIIGWILVSRAEKSAASETINASPSATALMEVKRPAGMPHQALENPGMYISFNKTTHNPNYVAWELTAAETFGEEPRRSDFLHDDRVEGCAYAEDYRRSGYDRGHMMPAADAKSDAEMMDDTFMLTNICPQLHALNAGSWKKLEEKCRQRAQRDSAIIIITGPVPGDRVTQRIGDSGVVVPQRFFKVILAPFLPQPYAIGFVMPNARVPGGMQATAMSVDEVERITGYDFFSALPDDIENDIESRYSFDAFSRLR